MRRFLFQRSGHSPRAQEAKQDPAPLAMQGNRRSFARALGYSRIPVAAGRSHLATDVAMHKALRCAATNLVIFTLVVRGRSLGRVKKAVIFPVNSARNGAILAKLRQLSGRSTRNRLRGD